jgi:MauM/NapG family ferredoxin protein
MNSPTVIRLRRLRRFSQALFLCLFFLLLIQMSYSGRTLDLAALDVTTAAPVNSFFKFDPFIGLSLLISTHTVYAGIVCSLIILAATILLGRFFCGWICPFGTLHHIVGRFRLRKKTPRGIPKIDSGYRRLHTLKYYLLFFLLLTGAFSLLQPAVLDPLSLLSRSCILSVFPAINYLTNRLLGMGMDSGVPCLSASSDWIYHRLAAGGWLGREFFSRAALPTGIIFIALLLANLASPRFWCRYLCPLGALLALVSRFSLLCLRKDDARCTKCAKCTLYCEGRSLQGCGDGRQISECLLCLNCAAECPSDALGFESLGVRDSKECGTDLTRRGLIVSIGSALVAIPLLRGARGIVNRSHLIRPPGAVPEDEFLAACIRCGSCSRICPTGVIHSSIAEAGIEGFWTPMLVPRTGYCVYSCTLCGQVCPSGAIRKLSIEEKMGSDRMRPVKIGAAAVNRRRCIAWSKNMTCLACEEVCPVSPKAIGVDKATVTRPGGESITLGRPLVDSQRCIGCGRCEYVCPVEGAAAIRVFSAGETRAG